MKIQSPLTKQFPGNTPIRLILERYLNKTSKKQWISDCDYFENLKNKALQTYDNKNLFAQLLVGNYSYFGRGERVFDGFSETFPKELADSERVKWYKWLELHKIYDACLSQPSSFSITVLLAESMGQNGNKKYHSSTLDSFFNDYVDEGSNIDLCTPFFQTTKDLFINSRILWFASDAFQDNYKWGSQLSILTYFDVKRPSFLARILLA